MIAKLIASFDNSSDGFSARKLSAFVGVGVSVVATFKFVEKDTIIEALCVWLLFSLLCLGIITAEQLIRFYRLRKGNDEQSQQSEEPNVIKVEDPKKDKVKEDEDSQNPKI